MISYIIPTRDRPERLALTLAALGSLRGHPPGPSNENGRCAAEVVIIDNASRFIPQVPERLANGIAVRLIRRESNEGAASRNAGVQAADPRSAWIVMLDDDSYPLDTGFIRRLDLTPPEVAAVSADIYLPGLSRRESGGLPEVFIGCGVAIRREVFLDLGGYDAGFNYYAEEYDLAARMLLAGYRIAFDPWFRVEHHKVETNRDINTIMARLVRNNGWVMQRYAPDELRRGQIREQRRRYRAISAREGAMKGYAEGLAELRRTINRQIRTPMRRDVFDRFTGLAYAREALAEARRKGNFRSAMIVDEGKNGWVVRKALAELGVRIVNASPYQFTGTDHIKGHPADGADVLIIGTMSPGPMLDAYERRTLGGVGVGPPLPEGALRVIAPWRTVLNRAPGDADVLTSAVRRSA